jgi:hydrogenase nickel incorporation protein HypA/HybF
MHELSIALSLIESVEEEAERHDGQVQAVHLKIGRLSGVVKEALVSAFELAREGTTLESVRLVIEEIPIVIYCPKCQARQTVTSEQWFCCPTCDTPAGEIVQGKELEVTGLEMG